MEKWQKEFIIKNGKNLISLISCNEVLLSILQPRYLSESDIAGLKATSNTHEKTAQLLKILYTKTGAYDALILGLDEVKQSGARDLLITPYTEQSKKLPPILTGIQDICKGASTEAILSKQVFIQGRLMSLDELFSFMKLDEKNILVKNYWNVKSELLSKDVPVLIDINIPKYLKYFIPRRVEIRELVDTSILKHNCNDIFIMRNMKLSSFASITPLGCSPERSGRQLQTLTTRFVLLDLEKDIETIARNNPKAKIHLFSTYRGMLKWHKSYGNISVIQKYTQPGQTECADEFLGKVLSCKYYRPVLIYGAAGIGKTSLFQYWARKFKQENPNSYVFQFYLKSLAEQLVTQDPTTEFFENILIPSVTNTDFGRSVFRKIVYSGQSIAIFLDGYSEVPEIKLTSVRQLLGEIVSKWASVRLFVTTRTYKCKELEETLGVLGYQLLQLQKSEQEMLLFEYFKCYLSCRKFNENNLREIVRQCAASLHLAERYHQISALANPLLCTHFAEALADRVKRDVDLIDTNNNNLIDIDDYHINGVLHNICKLYMDNRLGNLPEYKHTNTNKSNTKLNINTKQLLTCKAYYDIFPRSNFDFLFKREGYDYTRQILSSNYLGLGVLECQNYSNLKVRFLHPLFAEYLIGRHLTTKIIAILGKKQNALSFSQFSKRDKWRDILNFFLNNVLLCQGTFVPALDRMSYSKSILTCRFTHYTLANFINEYLKEIKWEPCENGEQLIFISLDSKTFLEQLTACLCENFGYLFSFLMSLHKRITGNHIIFPYDTILVTTKFCNFKIFKYIWDLRISGRIKFKILYDKNVASPIQVAVEQANFSKIKTILDHEPQSRENNTLLHVCLNQSIEENIHLISQRIEIVRLLVLGFPHLLDERDTNNHATPILTYGAHLDLVKCLLDLGADINAVTKNNEDVLSIFLERGVIKRIDEQTFANAMELFLSHGYGNFYLKNRKGETPLFKVLATAHVEVDALRSFLDRTNFSYTRNEIKALVLQAKRNKQSNNCISALSLQRGRKMPRNYGSIQYVQMPEQMEIDEGQSSVNSTYESTNYSDLFTCCLCSIT